MRAVILLAAGRSQRFTGGNKLLARRDGRTLLEHALSAARAAPAARIIVVTGHDADRIARIARGPRTRIVRAVDHRAGVSASLRAGFAALWPMERHIFVFLGDIADVPRALPHRLSRALGQGIAAVRARGRAGPGHPVLLHRPDAAVLDHLAGDRGLGELMRGRTRWVSAGMARLADVDTRRDLKR